MKKIMFFFSLITLFVFASCQHNGDPNTQYINVDCKIVMMGQQSKLTDDKFHEPELVKSVLIQLVEDTTLFCELISTDRNISNEYTFNKGSINPLTAEWFYNHRIGDIIHFDYIAKRRFFHIRNR